MFFHAKCTQLQFQTQKQTTFESKTSFLLFFSPLFETRERKSPDFCGKDSTTKMVALGVNKFHLMRRVSLK